MSTRQLIHKLIAERTDAEAKQAALDEISFAAGIIRDADCFKRLLFDLTNAADLDCTGEELREALAPILSELEMFL